MYGKKDEGDISKDAKLSFGERERKGDRSMAWRVDDSGGQ